MGRKERFSFTVMNNLLTIVIGYVGTGVAARFLDQTNGIPLSRYLAPLQWTHESGLSFRHRAGDPVKGKCSDLIMLIHIADF